MRDKPLFGDACNRCGLCCMMGPCGTARVLLDIREVTGQCPVLRPDGLGGHFCGLSEAVNTPEHREAVGIAIGSGVGCDMTHTAEDAAARADRIPAMREVARAARRNASPGAERLLRGWRLAPP